MERNKKVSRPLFCGKQNIAGLNVKHIRLSQPQRMSQNDLAIKMQLNGIPINKNKIQKIEAGICGVSDIELVELARALDTTVQQLLDTTLYEKDLYSKQQGNSASSAAQNTDIYSAVDYKEPEDK